MTDNEIIKALECCANNRGCTGKCPFNCNPSVQENCFMVFLDFVNRQKAEIDRLEHQLETMCLTLKLAKAEAVKQFAERLKAKKHECGCNFRKKPVFAVTEEKIDETYKEMVGAE